MWSLEDIDPIFLIQFERLERCVREFALYDPNSYAFRYPIDKSLNPYGAMPSTVDLINLRSVMDRMAKVFKSARELLQAQVEDLENVESWTDEETLMYAKDVLGIAEDEGTIEEAQDEWDLWQVE